MTEFTEGAPQSDDITLVVLEFGERGEKPGDRRNVFRFLAQENRKTFRLSPGFYSFIRSSLR